MTYNYDGLYNEVVEIDGESYYVQGYTEESEIQMYRKLDDLFEIERDYVQMVLEDSDT